MKPRCFILNPSLAHLSNHKHTNIRPHIVQVPIRLVILCVGHCPTEALWSQGVRFKLSIYIFDQLLRSDCGVCFDGEEVYRRGCVRGKSKHEKQSQSSSIVGLKLCYSIKSSLLFPSNVKDNCVPNTSDLLTSYPAL